VTIEGSAGQTETALSEKYFAGRPYGSQLGAWVSAQSSVVTTRGELESKLAEYEKKFPKGKVPLPPYWGGYRVKPRAWEFWQGRANRLHDRFRYTWSEGGWVIERLAP
jgi:pyridoxamine 5'-phosphate oxidase